MYLVPPSLDLGLYRSKETSTYKPKLSSSRAMYAVSNSPDDARSIIATTVNSRIP